MQVGSSWTTLPTTLPVHVSNAAVTSSVVYKQTNLVIVGTQTTSRESGAVLKVHNGNFKTEAAIPGLGIGGRYTWQATGQMLVSNLVLVHDNYLCAVISNPKHLKNAQGYSPAQQLVQADLKEYLSKGFLDHTMDFLGGLYACIAGGSNSKAPKDTFWSILTDMEDCGAALAASASAASDTSTALICAVGGYQTLSPKFYQVFSAKERVSRAARLFSTTTQEWRRLPDMNWRRKNCCAVVVDNYLYALGGQDDQGKTLNTVERIHLQDSSHVWEPCPPMKTPRHSFAATVAKNVIVVAGGCNSTTGRLDSVECFLHTCASDASSWKPLPPLQTPRMGAALSIVNQSKLVVAGGTKTPGPFWGTGHLDSIETLDIVTSVLDDPLALPPTIPSTRTRTTAPATTHVPIPMAQAQVLEEEDEHGFVPVIHAPPTAPGHWHRPQSVASIPLAQLQQQVHVPPSAPTAPLQSTSQVASLPTPIPPPQDKSTQSLEACMPLPPPLLPPTAAAAMPSSTSATTASSQSVVPNSQDDLSCAVCLERKKQVAFFCGHQVCLHCSPLLEECHICRTPIQGRIQLYDD